MQLFTLGLNHQTAPVSVREKLAFSAESLPAALNSLLGQHQVKEAAIVSTCNRTEIYCNTKSPRAAIEWLAGYHHLSDSEIEPYLYMLPNDQAVRHAFRVAAGLDSMVLGEAQILGQLKDAVRQAQDAGNPAKNAAGGSESCFPIPIRSHCTDDHDAVAKHKKR